MGFSLKQIRYFVAAAETGQVSQAAVELNVSQSAVTAAIKQLEGALQTRLFDRHSNGVTLSHQGHRFLQHARNVLAAVEEAERATQSARSDVSGSLCLGVTYTVAGYFLPAHLARFQRAFPGIEVALSEAPRSDVEQALVGGELDLAVLLTSNLENLEELVSETLLRSRRRLWLPLEHPLLHAERITLEDVSRQDYIMLTVDEAAQTAQRYWEHTSHQPRVIFRTSSVEAVRSMVSMAMGVTILSDMVYRPWSLEGQRIETRTVEGAVPSMDVGIAWRRGAKLSPAATTFLDYMSRTFNGAGARLGE